MKLMETVLKTANMDHDDFMQPQLRKMLKSAPYKM